MKTPDVDVPERLRGLTRNQLGSACASSSLVIHDCFFRELLVDKTDSDQLVSMRRHQRFSASSARQQSYRTKLVDTRDTTASRPLMGDRQTGVFSYFSLFVPTVYTKAPGGEGVVFFPPRGTHLTCCEPWLANRTSRLRGSRVHQCGSGTYMAHSWGQGGRGRVRGNGILHVWQMQWPQVC